MPVAAAGAAGLAVGLAAAALARFLNARLPSILENGPAGLAAPASEPAAPWERFPLPGLVAGALLAAAAAVGAGAGLPAWMVPVLGGVLAVAALIDLRHRILPDLVTVPLLAAGLVVAAAGAGTQAMGPAMAGGVLGGGLGVILRRGRRGAAGTAGMGGGDVKLLAALGAWLGPLGVTLALLLAGVAQAAVFLGLRVRGGDAAWLPFGPALALAGLAVLAGGLDRLFQ